MNKTVSWYSSHAYKIDIFLSATLIVILAEHYFKLFLDLDNDILVFFAFLGVIPVFISALYSIFKKEWASMDMLASIALLFSMIGGEWASAVFISLMLSSARILENITEHRTKRSLNSLLKLRPEKAKIEKDGRIIEIKAKNVNIGDIVIVDTGEYIPIDGVVISGNASINESSLTGESLPVEKKGDSKVHSGTFVVSGSLKIKTLLIGKDTTLEKIISLIEQAEDEKPKTQTLGEKFGKIYLSVVFIGSFLLLYITHNLPLVLSVVLVVCADDIAIAIPLAYLRAIGQAASKGVIIKGGKHLETLCKVDVIVFDKTGTLTTGKLKVDSFYVNEKSNKTELMRLGSVASVRSKHPIAKAVSEYTYNTIGENIFPDEANVIEGKGVVAKVKGEEVVFGREFLIKEMNCVLDNDIKEKVKEVESNGGSISYLAKNGEVIGFFAVKDTIKKDAKETVKQLYSLGIKKIVILSGDNERVVKSVASEIGIKDFHAELLPQDKLDKLKLLHKEHKVAMVGDGVNDAAALAISHVGIAMGSLGADSAIESAEIVLMHDNLLAIPNIVKLARNVNLISKQDFGIWIITNVVGLFFAFAGLIGPSGAAAYNFVSDFFPLFNSLRVRMNKI